MIPTVNNILNKTIEFKVRPSKNYKMHFGKEVVNGYCDELVAMEQVIYKILNTERYKYLIYSWNYGIELADLFGKPVSYVCTELKRRITEALVQDDRVENVDSFSFDIQKRGVVHTTFTVHTIFGSVNLERSWVFNV